MKGGIYHVRGGFQVRFGAKHTRWFKSLPEAERHLNFIRTQEDMGQFDQRDWSRDKPLGFSTMASQWLEQKKIQVRPGTYKNLNGYIVRAAAHFKTRNVKLITEPEIVDYLFRRKDITEKTRENMRSCLQDFMRWACKRAGCLAPEMKPIQFELGWRQTIDVETQQNIINKIKELSFRINPRIWFGIHCLSRYISLRPVELLSIKEKDINHQDGIIFISYTKEHLPKMVYLLDDDLEFIRSLPQGLPDLYFFRHNNRKGRRFGHNLLYNYWMKACKTLDITGIDLYGGTRHSTVVALKKYMTPEEIKSGTMHKTNKAFERYFQRQAEDSLKVYQQVQEMQNG